MISKSTDDLIESYTEEIKNKLPLRYALCIILGIVLYWGSVNGKYKSALLGTLNLSLNNAISGLNSLIDSPIYVYALFIIATYFSFLLIQTSTNKYIRHITNLPGIRKSIELLISNDLNQQVDSRTEIDKYYLESLSDQFNSTRKKVGMLASNSQSFFVAGIVFSIISYNGNLLDLFVGSLFIILGLVGIHKSCKLFIHEQLPQKAEIRRILLIYTKKKSTAPDFKEETALVNNNLTAKRMV